MAFQATRRTTLSGHEGSVVSVAFSPDGKTVLTGCFDGEDTGGSAKLWDAASGKCRATLSGHRVAVLVAALSPDGQTVVPGGWDCTARLWDAAAARAATLSPGTATE